MIRVGFLVLFMACGSPADEGEPDSGLPSECTDDSDCSDGVFCNGTERCVGALCIRVDACEEGQRCDEERARCFTECDGVDDADGDGARAEECGGNDCDDSDPGRFPGNTEICDADDIDEDCDPQTFGFRDLDRDGIADIACCNGEGSTRVCGTDCDDAAANVSPRSPEVCNGFDDDCDESIDEDVQSSFAPDEDGDGFGAMGGTTIMACTRPEGYAPTADDCDDDNRRINPGAVEICDGEVDEDCSGEVDDVEQGCSCADGESRDCGLAGRCEGAIQECSDGQFGACSVAPIGETCNRVDDDCDGTVDEGQTVECYLDGDNDGLALFGATVSEQCPDEARADEPFLRCPLFYTAAEPLSEDTSDCDDSRAMETLPNACFGDADSDGFGAGAPTYKCPSDPCPSGLVPSDTDCCDQDNRAFPGQTSYFSSGANCGGWDFNCNGEAEHRHGFYSCTRIVLSCTGGTRGMSPYFRTPNVGCGSIGAFADQCNEVGGNCVSSWSGSGVNIHTQQCR